MTFTVADIFEMLKHQGEYCEIYRKQQVAKRKAYNVMQLEKKYYGNSKEYKKEWYKNGAMFHK